MKSEVSVDSERSLRIILTEHRIQTFYEGSILSATLVRQHHYQIILCFTQLSLNEVFPSCTSIWILIVLLYTCT